MSDRTGWAKSVSAFAIGLGVGAALGVLFAPRSGDDTRENIRSSAKGGMDRAVAAGEKLTRRAQEGIDEVKGRVQQAAEVGERAYREAKNSSS